jgi:diguanylate cyclase (GGDEF)-like protein/PAS domain S-box-containing protein
VDLPQADGSDVLARLPALRFLALTSDLAAIADLSGRLRYANPALAARTGCSADELAGRPAVEVVHPDDRGRFLAATAALLSRPDDDAAITIEGRVGSEATGWRWCSGSFALDRDTGLVYVIGREITEQREAEERFRRAFEDDGIAKAMTSLDGRFLRVNRALADLLGRTPEQLEGMSVAALTLPAHREDARRAMERMAAGELSSYRTDKCYLRADGSEVWVSLRASVVRDEDGRPQFFLSHMVDIAERRAAQRALETSERRFRILAAASPAGIFALDREGRLGYANDRLREIMALGPGPAVGDAWLDRIAPEDRERTVAETRRAREENVRTSFDVRLDVGVERWGRVHLAPISDGGGEVNGFVGTLDDVTAELTARHALSAREAEYRMLAEHSTDFLSRHAPDARFLYASPVAKTMLGWDPQVLIGHSAEDLGLTHPEDREILAQAWNDCRDSGGSRRCTYRALRRDGSMLWLETAFRAVRDASGEVVEIVCVSRDVSERRNAEVELAHRALHDALTGLPNRTLFLDRLAHALRRSRRTGRRIAVLFVDLDRFKVVNDSLGHRAGDALLVDVAMRLSEAVRPSDTLARFGGDELTLLCEDVEDDIDAQAIAGRLLATFEEPFEVGDGEAFLQASVGIAMSADGFQTPDDLIRDADAAMYRAKESGTGMEVFDEAMREDVLDRLMTESQLRRGIERGELRLHCQPIVELGGGRITGFECLVRWQHPQRGLLPPAAFIPLAEETGLVVALGDWVVREACATLRRVIDATGRDDLQIGVNISPRHLRQPDLVPTVRAALAEHGLSSRSLVVEITESAVMESQAAPVLDALKALGVRLAMDDFGTGYSSLSQLRRFPLDLLKVDRSFIRGLVDGEGSSIAGAIVSVARALGLRTVAEGIEDADQLAAVAELGCDLGQGFYLARPMPAEELTALIASSA